MTQFTPSSVRGALPSKADLLAIAGGIAMPLLVLGLCALLWKGLDVRTQRRRALQAALMPKPAKLDPAAYARGQQLYAMACIACHGPQGKGVPKLGKDLTSSKFARQLSDEKLAAFISAGRGLDDPLNTTGVPMPPRGGRADFTDANIADVVTFLRGLGEPARVPEGPLPAVQVVLAAPEPAPAPAPAAAVAAVPNTAVMPDLQTAASGSAPSNASLDPQAIARGKKAFVSCMACHGKDGTGLKNLGKDLVHSQFAIGLSDDELVAFIKKGRGPTDPGNTTKVAMPPKGGNPAIKDEQLHDIVIYLRSLQAPVAVSAAPAATTQPTAPASPTSAAPSLSAAAPSPEAVARGKRLFVSCMACHGKDGTGLKNLGKDLVHSSFVLSLSDDALVDFIKKGRGPTDPLNTTHVAMPPKGGNPALKDEQIRDIVAYLRSLQQQRQQSAQAN